MRKANATGRLPELIKENPKYGDFSEPLSYQESLNLVLHANDQFANLPAHVRSRFQNNPQIFLEFTSDPSNLPEMVKMGLAIKRENEQNDNATPTVPPTPTTSTNGSPS